MSVKYKILLLIFGLSYTNGLSAQTLKAKIFNKEDSLSVMFANVVLVDSLGNILTGTSTNEKGEFNIQILDSAHFIKIYQQRDFAELHIINLNQEYSDTLDLGQLPMIKAPPYIQVQFMDISERKERRKQRQLIKDYNKQIMRYKDLIVDVNNQNVKLTVKPIKCPDSGRLKLVYILDLDEINKKN